MLFDIEVRPGKDSGFFQYYTETVEAATSHDAVARVQRANPGCQVRCTRSYNKSSGGSSSSSGISFDGSGSGIVGIVGLVAAAWAFFTFTPWILMLLGGAAGTWIGEKVTGMSVEDYGNQKSTDDGSTKRAAIILAIALFAGGFGFIKGDEIKKDFDASSNTTEQIQQSK